MTRTLIVTGSHTDVGKTFVACRIVERWVEDGLTVDVRKPVMSGFDPGRADESDAGRLLRAAGLFPEDPEELFRLLDEVCPWRFAAPLAPDAAARAEGITLSLDEIAAFTNKPSNADAVLVETAGGVMSPLTHDSTALDLIARVRAPTILVVGAYLGGISHGLTAHMALTQRGVDVAAVVVNRATADDAEPFRRFLPAARVLVMGEGVDEDDEAVKLLAQLTRT